MSTDRGDPSAPEPIRLAILLTGLEDWALLRGVLRAAAANADFDVVIVEAFRAPAELESATWKSIADALDRAGLPVRAGSSVKVLAVDPDVVLTAALDDARLPAGWKFDAIERHARLVAVTPAPIGLGGDHVRHRCVSAAVERADLVVVRDAREAVLVRGTPSSSARAIRVVGAPELDAARVVGAASADPAKIFGRTLGPDAKLLLWNPSYAVGDVVIGGAVERGFSSFVDLLSVMAGAVAAHPELHVACAVHPLLPEISRASGLVDAALWSGLERLHREAPNFRLVAFTDVPALAAHAHAVVTDPSAWLGPLTLGGAPVCLVHDELGLPLDRDDPSVARCRIAKNTKDVEDVLAALLEGRLARVDASAPAAPECAGAKILPLLVQLVDEELSADPVGGAVSAGAGPGGGYADGVGRALLPLDFFVLQNVTGAGFALYHFLGAHPQIHLPHRDDCDKAILTMNERAYLEDPRNRPSADAEVLRTGFMVHVGAHLREDMPGRIASLCRPDARLLQLVRDPREVIVASHRRHILANVTSRMCEELGRPAIVGALPEHPTHEALYQSIRRRMFFHAEGKRYADRLGAWTIVDAHDLWPESTDATMRRLYGELGVDPAFHSPIFHKDFHGEATKMLHFSQQVIRVLGIDMLVRLELTRDVPFTHGGFHRELARVASVSDRLTQPFPDTPVSLVMIEEQFRRLPSAVQHALGREQRLQTVFEERILPEWVEQVNRIHAEVHAAWITEVEPALLARMHEELDADLEQFFRLREDLEEKWGWFANSRVGA